LSRGLQGDQRERKRKMVKGGQRRAKEGVKRGLRKVDKWKQRRE
jgi:hypothetical protein